MEEKSEKSGLRSLLSADTTKGRLENWSFIITVISGIMVALGIGLGSFVQGTVYIASFGSFFFMIGVIVFIISQFAEEVK